MAHELELNTDGTARMFYVGDETPWHGLGVRLDAPPTAAQAIRAAGLDWEVELRPVYARTFETLNPAYVWNNPTYTPIEGSHAVTRLSDNACIGVVGQRYTPVQNSQAFRFFDRLISDGSATYETAGSLKGGRVIWVLVKLHRSAQIAHDDRVESYLFLSTSHDGSTAVQVKFTDIRVVCNNTLNFASEGAGDKLSARHSANVDKALELIAELIDAQQSRFSASVDQYVRLAALDVDVEMLRRYVRVVLRDIDPEDADAVKSVDADADAKPARGENRIIDIFENDPTCTMRSIRGSWWAGLNALTRYVDYERGADNDKRFFSAMLGQGATVKQRALSSAVALSGCEK
jgi:phage/plasmid-like protein (TIGR03299 family)